MLEELYVLMYYIGFAWSDAYNLPISIRKWFIKRFIKEISKENNPAPVKATHHQTPETRMFQGSHRLQSPNRLNRPF